MKSTNEKLFTVITTIFPPGPCMEKLGRRLRAIPSPVVVVGDKKGPSSFDLEGATFLSLADQKDLGFTIEALLPTGHYARKNLGYLYAVRRGAKCIYETDDDNAPSDQWNARGKEVNASKIKHDGWTNVYKYFTDKLIWPRGLPLDKVRNNGLPDELPGPELLVSPIQQGLVDGAPDVDAAWHLILGGDFTFSQSPSVYLEPGAWCPFNSQNTWWWPEAFALLYLPSHCSFRMTDIWRSFVAQRCLWAMGYGVIFHAPDVWQDRNEHNLMRDFEAEVPGYLGNNSLIETLNKLELISGTDSTAVNLHRCYDALIREGFFSTKELDLVEAWCSDLKSAAKSSEENEKTVQDR